MQWNLTVARDLARDVSLRAGYVGSRGVHQLFRVEDGDIVLPSLTSQGYLWPTPVGSGTRQNNHIKRISDTFNAQFRTELFNVLNHTNFAPPLDNRNIFDSAGSPIGNAGLITSTQTPSRQIQVALKLIW